MGAANDRRSFVKRMFAVGRIDVLARKKALVTNRAQDLRSVESECQIGELGWGVGQGVMGVILNAGWPFGQIVRGLCGICRSAH